MHKFYPIALTIASVAAYFAARALERAALETEAGRTTEATARLQGAKPLRSLGHSEFRLPRRDNNERMFRFSPDGKLLAACNWQEVKIWTFPDGKLQHDFSDAIDSNCIEFSQDGRELLVFDERNKSITRFDVKTGEKLRTSAIEEVRRRGATSYTFLDSGRWLCATDGRLTIWDASTGRLLLLKPSVQSGRHPVASNGELTVWGGNIVERIDLRTGNRLQRFNNYQKRTNPICSSDGTRMAGYSVEDKAVVFWNAATNELVGGRIPVGEREWQSTQAALSADGTRLVFWTKHGQWIFDRKMAVFDVQTGQLISEFTPPDAYFLEEPIISPDGKWVFPSGERSAFTPINADTGEPFQETPGHVLSVESLSFTPDGSTLIVGSGDQRRAWDVATGKPGQVFEAYYHLPYAVAVDDRRALVLGLRNGGLRLQDIATGETQRFYDLGESMHLTKFGLGADRKTFVGQIGRTFRRWDIETGDTATKWTMPEQPYGWEMRPYGRYSFGGFVLGGTRLYRFDQVRPVKRLPDQSIDWGQYDLLLEDWATQRVTNRLPIPYADHFNVAEVVDDRTLAVVTSDDWGSRASNRLEPGSTFLLLWDVATGWERLRVTRPRPEYYSAFSLAAMTPDVRLVATDRNRKQIEIWNGFTGELIQQFDAPMDVSKLTFSDDGSTLASGHIDGSIYLWDAREAWNTAIPKTRLDPTEAERCWEDLAGDGSRPALALRALLGDTEAAVGLLQRKLRPAADVNLRETISAVMSAGQEESEAKVRELGPRAVDALYEELEEAGSDDGKAKVGHLIDIAIGPAPPALRRHEAAARMLVRR